MEKSEFAVILAKLLCGNVCIGWQLSQVHPVSPLIFILVSSNNFELKGEWLHRDKSRTG